MVVHVQTARLQTFFIGLKYFSSSAIKLRRKASGGEVHIFNKHVLTRGVRALVTFFIRDS